jgi:hypothetical protein
MKDARWTILSIAAFIGILVIGRNAGAACSDQTVKGTYAFTCTALPTQGSVPSPPVTQLGQLVLDGTGGVTGVLTATLNGKVLVGPFTQITGTYSVDPGCTGSISFTSPINETLAFSLFTNGFFAAGASPLGSGALTCEFQQLQGLTSVGKAHG